MELGRHQIMMLSLMETLFSLCLINLGLSVHGLVHRLVLTDFVEVPRLWVMVSASLVTTARMVLANMGILINTSDNSVGISVPPASIGVVDQAIIRVP